MQHFVEIVDLGIRFPCDDTESILIGMARLREKGIPIGCCGGGCGVCKIEVITGDVMCLSMSSAHVSCIDNKQKVVLACRAYPRSDLTVRILGHMKKVVDRVDSTELVSVSLMEAWINSSK